MKDKIKETLDELENYYDRDITLDEIKLIRDYITNLQEENERLKKELDNYSNALNGKITQFKAKEVDKLQERINKAIEYIEKNKYVDDYGKWTIDDDDDDLLNILQNGEQNE